MIVGPIWYALYVDTNISISVRRARLDDAPALAALVNRAYEVERSFVDGDRTDAEEIAKLVAKGTFLVLERSVGASGVLAAAVFVDVARENGGYIGMLSVDPALQGMGLGTRLVRIAEAMCEAMGASQVRLRIVNLREELARWYRSLGYQAVGTAPYDHRPVKQPCHFVDMHKWLATPAVATAAAM
jgi:ribosomal protein S18 acetylase RimI-like enzyme